MSRPDKARGPIPIPPDEELYPFVPRMGRNHNNMCAKCYIPLRYEPAEGWIHIRQYAAKDPKYGRAACDAPHPHWCIRNPAHVGACWSVQRSV